ncbi:MAG TPA: YebC/PmpR family DNA-binding transcriptional regulator [Erysipelothrix sp.]
MGRAFEVRKASMAKTAAKKTKIYSRYGKELYMAAKNGIPDPEMNVELRRLIEEARSKEVPSNVIERAIEKAKGGTGEDYHASTFEGFGPGASTVIVECLTDNDNRTVSEVRNCFTKSKGKMGVSGSVSHSYEHVAVISFEHDDSEAIFELVLEAGVDLSDIEEEEGHLLLTLAPTDLHKAKEAIKAAIPDVKFDVSEISYIPFDYVTLTDEQDQKDFQKLMDMLDEVEDVQNVYHNVADGV